MIINKGELVNSILRAMGLVQSQTDSTILTDIDNRINAIQDWIALKKDWEWRRRTYHVTTKAPYETGTVTVTKGSRSVAGSGTAWTKIVEMGYLFVNNHMYKIHEWVDGTTLKLAPNAVYPDTTAAGQTYKIVYPFVFLNPEIASIITVKHEGRELDVKGSERLVLNSAHVSNPEEIFIADRMTKTFYNTGTVTMTNNSSAVVGSGTAFTSDMEGMPFQVNEFAEVYMIDTVTDGTHLTLSRAYRGESGAGKEYTIGKEGSLLMGIRHIPDDYYFLEIETLIFPQKLKDNTDYSMIPNHAPLFHGCMYYAYTQATQKDPVRVQQELANFRETMGQLESSYKVVANSRWTSETELRARSNNGLAGFDPLNQRYDRF